MRVKKAGINIMVNLVTYVIGMLPNFIVRSIFLTTLGNELLGLNSLYTNIINYLSIIELGIGSVIIFSLYKPFAENDIKKVNGYLKYYSKFYKTVGISIFILGILILPFLNIFIKSEVNIYEAKIYFILFLINTVISYFFSYKICVLNVAQENYKVSIATTISKILIAILQGVMLKIYASFSVYIIIQIIINLIYYLIINFYINSKYKWLKNINDGYISDGEKVKLRKNIGSLFFHKIGSLFVVSTDNLVISAFINLKTVGIFNSYYMVISAAQAAIGNSFAGITASIGDFLVKENSESAYELHKKLFFLNFWVVSFITIAFYNTLKQFVIIWLGNEQILNSFTIIILLVNFYFSLMRVSVEKFKDAAGLYYQDRYAAAFEAGINFVTSIILVNLIGLPGVFLGTLISNFSVVFWVKPKITYKYVFKKPLKNYFITYIKYLLISIVPLIITSLITAPYKEVYTINAFLINCLINVITINGVYLIIFRKNNEFKYYKNIIIRIVRNKFL